MAIHWPGRDEIGAEYWAEMAREAQRRQNHLQATERRFAAELGYLLDEEGTRRRQRWCDQQMCPGCYGELEVVIRRPDWQDERCRDCKERFWRHGGVLERL